MKKKLLLFCLLTIFANLGFAQNALRSNQGWGVGWDENDFFSSTGFGTTFGKIYKNSAGSGNRYFRLATIWDGNTRIHGPGSDAQITLNSPVSLASGNSFAYFINVANNQDNYVFRTKNGDGRINPSLVVFRVQGDVRSVTSVAQTPTTAGIIPSTPVNVTATLDGALNTGQGVYIRWSSNNFSSSVVQEMTGSGTTYSGTIPAQVAGTNVKYYVFTSGAGLTIAPADADFYTINGNTNSGANYSYTVLSSIRVVVNPTFPTDNEAITVDFDATGTALAGANKVYFHSGVSTKESAPTAFSTSKGNWGADDGIGLMTSTGINKWQIILSSGLRSYFNLNPTDDVFGLNFLFRSADGTLKEDRSGANFNNPVNPGNYFSVVLPATNAVSVQVNTPFSNSNTSSTPPTSWTLQEVDSTTDAVIATINTQSGGTTLNTMITPTSLGVKKYKVIVNYAGTIKYKTFTANPFNPVTTAARPTGMKPGINYNSADATKATLILHAPTFTQYKKGTGIVSGTNTTAPKKVVYVIGDFNNWTPSEAYKMNRDTDGWNGTTDADNDNDRGDYWWLELTGLTPGQEYVFQYLIDDGLQIADPYADKISDRDDAQIPPSVYPNLLTYRPQAQDRASVLQTNKTSYTFTAPPFAKPTIDKLNIYELHFRDFTTEGTYLAAIEKLDYIKNLGINAIHVMPVSEFEGNDSWGYNPNFYFAADKAYGTPDDLKKFIDECHARKIQVFNDIVLNHAFYSNVMARMYWNSIDNKPANDNPWFNPNHKMVFNTGGHWGADWNHESVWTQNMVDRILDYWVDEFKFDGYRFDFTKGFGQTEPNPADDWASNYNQDRIDLLLRMANGLKTRKSGTVVIFEHLANATEDKALSDTGILMWSGVGHHNAIKKFVLGYSAEDTNIYDSGIYRAPARDFKYANWMSYAESHDEERLGYEVTQYFNGTKSLNNIVDRLKIATGFNLLLPGPRMLWQFQELGYDVSINFNGRTGRKPVRWEYFDDPKRKELYQFASEILYARNTYDLYSIEKDDYGNIGLGVNNLDKPRVMRYSSKNNEHVIIVSNLDTVTSRDAVPGFDTTGTWYRYNGNTTFDGTTQTVSNTGMTYLLQPNETVMFTNFVIPKTPQITIAVTPAPNTSICADSTINFTSTVATGTGTGPFTYIWTGPNGFTSNEQNPFIENCTTAASGKYNLLVRDANGYEAEASISVTVISKTITQFDAVAPICSGSILAELPTISNNTIAGTWLPALNNTTTTTYTFTPTITACATTATLSITVNPKVVPTFDAVTAICDGATPNLPTFSKEAITGTWTLNSGSTYTFTPDLGQCATTTQTTVIVNPLVNVRLTAILPQGGIIDLDNNRTINVVIACQGKPFTMPTVTNGITGTWSPPFDNTVPEGKSTVDRPYTFTPDPGQCAKPRTISVNLSRAIDPQFTQMPDICNGAIASLPRSGRNPVAGLWSPPFNNKETTEYTFNSFICIVPTKMTVRIIDNTIVPTFNQVAPIVRGAILNPLPRTSSNGIRGTWSPALDNRTTRDYTFTPASGQCATKTTMTIVVVNSIGARMSSSTKILNSVPEVTTIDDSVKSSIVVYPNPVTSFININTSVKINQAIIFDMKGKMLLDRKVSDTKIDVSSLSKGEYLIKLILEDNSIINRVFVKN